MTQLELRNKISELRQRRNNVHSVLHLGATATLIAAALWLLKTQPLAVAAVPAFLLIGLMQYRLVMASHEATHKTLFHPVWLNETVGLLTASLVGVSLFNYRKAHMEHHKSPQSIADDVDGYIYRPLLTCEAGWPRFWKLFLGLFVDIFVKFKRKIFGDDTLPKASAKDESSGGTGGLLAHLKSVGVQLAPIAVVQTVVLVCFAVWWEWWGYFIFWFIPIFLIALGMDRARTFLEHSYNYFFPGPALSDLAQARQDTIDVDTNALERFLFAPFGFAYHQAHHAQLTVPYYNLRDLAGMLEEHQPGYHRRIKGSYLGLLFKVLWAR